MKRKKAQEHDEAIARAQADDRREHLLAELRAHQASAGEPPEPPSEPSPSVTESSAASEPEAGSEAGADSRPADEPAE